MNHWCRYVTRFAWLLSTERRMGGVHGLPTLHASIDGNAVWSTLSLRIADYPTEPLVQRLLDTQWPDAAGTAIGERAGSRSTSPWPPVGWACR
jgi:hypothetical protein